MTFMETWNDTLSSTLYTILLYKKRPVDTNLLRKILNGRPHSPARPKHSHSSCASKEACAKQKPNPILIAFEQS
eukprot:scaffold2003_cov157-Amphora_coffeaeformis.AAC.7